MLSAPLRRSARLAERTATRLATKVEIPMPISNVATSLVEHTKTMTISETIILLDEVKKFLNNALMEFKQMNVTTLKLSISCCTHYKKAVHLLGKIKLPSRIDGDSVGELVMHVLESCNKDVTNIHYKMGQCYEDTHLTVLGGRMFVQYIFIRINNVIEQLNLLQEWTK